MGKSFFVSDFQSDGHPVQISSKVKDVNKINSHVSFYFLPSLQLFLLISKKKIV